MNMVLDILSALALGVGSLMCLIGGLGLLRLPDFFCRLHASSLNETLGTPLILLGLILQLEPSLDSVKLIFIGIFILLTNPTATHAMSRAALHAGSTPVAKRPAAPSNSAGEPSSKP